MAQTTDQFSVLCQVSSCSQGARQLRLFTYLVSCRSQCTESAPAIWGWVTSHGSILFPSLTKRVSGNWTSYESVDVFGKSQGSRFFDQSSSADGTPPWMGRSWPDPSLLQKESGLASFFGDWLASDDPPKNGWRMGWLVLWLAYPIPF